MAMSESVYLVEKEKREDEELINKQLEVIFPF
jgi:hypothetical protein